MIKYNNKILTGNFFFFVMLLVAPPIIINLDSNLHHHADSRCANGRTNHIHNCEKVRENKGSPCPNGYQTSPDGDCEKAESGNDGL